MNFLNNSDLLLVLQNLSQLKELIAPIKTPLGPVFSAWRLGDELDLSSNPLMPPTNFLIPQVDRMIEYTEHEPEDIMLRGITAKRTLFGIRQCDIAAIAILDEKFKEDERYQQWRQDLTIVGLWCNTLCSYGFCVSTKSVTFERIMKTVNVMLVPASNNDGYFVFDNSSEMTDEFLSVYNSTPNIRIPSISEVDFEQFAKRCISCGSCGFVCPTCHCFTIYDQDKARIRCRDNCLLEGFHRMAGGHNPRRKLADRLKDRFVEKFVHGDCVGCGRCFKVCPAGGMLIEKL